MTQAVEIGGPYFEDLVPGQVFEAPAVTLTSGHAALYQAITGDRLRLPLDSHTSHRVTGLPAAIVHPLLVINMAIGQTTEVSQNVKANLFYRGLILKRQMHLGETLRTTTRVVALRQNKQQPGRPATGMAALEVITRNQDNEEVLHFWRCPMLPCRNIEVETGWRDDLDRIGSQPMAQSLNEAIPRSWQLEGVRSCWQGRKVADLSVGMRFRIEARDTVTSAPELVRATLNMAMAHTDSRLSYLGKRIVYGGHTISLAFSQLTRALPNLLTMLAWEGCDHLGPVVEGDRIRSECTVLDIAQTPHGAVLKLHAQSHATREDQDSEQPVLDWRFWVLAL